MAFLDSIFNPTLLPLFTDNPFWGIIIVAFIISLGITLLYKLVTDQKEMKRLKEQQKDFQKTMKGMRDRPEEMMKVQKEAMKVNMQYMKQSFKPTLITMIPIFLIFGWMAGHLSFEPIYPDETYSITATFQKGINGEVSLVASDGTEILNGMVQAITDGKATWRLKSATEGKHFLTVKTAHDERTKKVLITKELSYEEQTSAFDSDSDLKEIRINYKDLKPLGSTSILGWEPGWLGLYIIFSIIFSMVLRKLFKVY